MTIWKKKQEIPRINLLHTLALCPSELARYNLLKILVYIEDF